ncbi:MAG TPA: type II secretion system protein [Gemmatimonadota bacterium]|nr:type II secretion system protein [Gemmatimonadota bacterium]
MRTSRPPTLDARSRRGITLIEVLIVMTLVGILAAVAIPRVGGSSDPYQAVDEARKIHAALASARAGAIATQRQHRFVLSNGGTWTVQQENPVGTWNAMPDSGAATGTVTMDGASSGTVVFYPRGRVDNARSIVVAVNGHQQRINLLASGLVRW